MRQTGDEWGQLMAAAQTGHAPAYRQLLNEIRRWLNGFYGRRLPSGMVEDAVQDTLIAIHVRFGCGGLGVLHLCLSLSERRSILHRALVWARLRRHDAIRPRRPSGSGALVMATA